MTNDQQKYYSRGYYAGARGRWPEHRPPTPPDEVVAALMAALRELRDECDSALATLEPDDEFVRRLGPRVDAADEAMRRVSGWLLAQDSPP